MLSLAKAAKDYYLRKLGEISPGEDYYLRGGTAAGRWRGSGAEVLGLEGGVSTEGLVRLFDGRHPGTGEPLGRSLRKDGVAAWDVTFSADKSVSLLWALGDPQIRRQVVEAFEEATVSAFGYLESVASSTRGAARVPVVDENGDPVLDEKGAQRFRVETWPIATSGYVAASFTEFTSRAEDPQLHTHVVVANKVQGVDGVWRSLDGRLLYRHQLAAGYLHEAVLRRELTRRLGVRWQAVRNGMADIEGFTRSQIETFSRRRHELEAWRESGGLPDTAAARQVAVLATRSPKRDHPLDDLEVEWRRRAAGVGLTPEAMDRMLRHRREVAPVAVDGLFARLASAEGLTEQASTFGRAEVVKAIAGALPEGGTRHEIEQAADAFLQARQVVPVLPDTGSVADPHRFGGPAYGEGRRLMRTRDGGLFPAGGQERRFTTAELLATEARVVDAALAGIDAGRWTAPGGLIEAGLRRRPHLTEGQRAMVRRFASSGNAIDVGIGPAGTGKTAVMAVIGELCALTGTPLVGGALAGRTAAGLQDATGIPSVTLARLIAEGRGRGGLPSGAVMVVDEAGMVDTRRLAAIVDLVEAAGGKLVLIGDDRQLPEIGAGGLFRALTHRLPAVGLTDNVRQRDGWERDALTELRSGSADQAIDAYRRQERLIVGQNRNETLERAVDDWYRHVATTGELTSGLLIGYDNDTVGELNRQARSRLAAAGALTGPDIRAGNRTFQTGDRILCRTNQHRLGVLNGDLGTVTKVDRGTRSITVRSDRDGSDRELPSWYLEQGHLDHGYALTGHKAQGVTTGRSFVVVGGTTDREWVYVAMSRGKEGNTLYLAGPEPLEHCTHLTHTAGSDALDGLTAALQRSSAQTAAIDHSNRSAHASSMDARRPPSASDVAARVAWLAAKRRAERERAQRSAPDLAVGR